MNDEILNSLINCVIYMADILEWKEGYFLFEIQKDLELLKKYKLEERE